MPNWNKHYPHNLKQLSFHKKIHHPHTPSIRAYMHMCVIQNIEERERERERFLPSHVDMKMQRSYNKAPEYFLHIGCQHDELKQETCIEPT